MSSNITVKKTKNGTSITSSTNARSKKTQAELDAIKNKKDMTLLVLGARFRVPFQEKVVLAYEWSG